MKQLLVRLLCALLCLFMCLGAVACGKTKYADDVAAAKVAETAIEAIGSTDDYIDGTADYFSFYFEGEQGAELVTDCRFMFHAETTDVNEVGVLRVASAKDASAVEQLARNYLAEQTVYLRSFAQNYSPEDMTKIDNADVEIIGCYVIYYILSPEDEASALNAVREALTLAS